MKALIEKRFEESAAHKRSFVQENVDRIEAAACRILESIRAGGKIMIVGNGGSAADAQHMAAEFVNRFLRDRRPLPAIALTTDSSILTSISNDTEFREIFSRQIEALGKKQDVVIAITTSGNSPNILQAITQAKRMGIYAIALTGGDGGKVKSLADLTLCVSSTREAARIQEVHLTLEHILCEIVESSVVGWSLPCDQRDMGENHETR
jgi:D-sedoheptulose 7-phosphate isomerase